MGVHIEPDALSRYWDELLSPLWDTRCEDVLAALAEAIEEGDYVLDRGNGPLKLAGRVDSMIDDPPREDFEYTESNLTSDPKPLDRIENAGAIYRTAVLGDRGRAPVLVEPGLSRRLHELFDRLNLPPRGSAKRELFEWYREELGLPFDPPTGRARAITEYLGSAILVDEAIDPREARLYAALPDHVRDKVSTVDVVFREYGNPDPDDVDEEFPFQDLLLGESHSGRYLEYVIFVDLELEGDRLSEADFDDAIEGLYQEVLKLHAAALYDEYDPFALGPVARELETAAGEPKSFVNPDARLENAGITDERAAFYPDLTPSPDKNRIRIATLHQKES